MPVFWVEHSENHQKISKKRGARKSFYSVSERFEDGLSSYAFISVSTILTKTDFFWVGGGSLKSLGTVSDPLEIPG